MSSVKRNLITMKVACERGGFKRTKAYELIADGKIIAYKMGHQTMVDVDSIDAYHASLPRIQPGNAALGKNPQPGPGSVTR
jgi:excisionase family DNA binding protein